jgi:hypothetical protein
MRDIFDSDTASLPYLHVNIRDPVDPPRSAYNQFPAKFYSTYIYQLYQFNWSLPVELQLSQISAVELVELSWFKYHFNPLSYSEHWRQLPVH